MYIRSKELNKKLEWNAFLLQLSLFIIIIIYLNGMFVLDFVCQMYNVPMVDCVC